MLAADFLFRTTEESTFTKQAQKKESILLVLNATIIYQIKIITLYQYHKNNMHNINLQWKKFKRWCRSKDEKEIKHVVGCDLDLFYLKIYF